MELELESGATSSRAMVKVHKRDWRLRKGTEKLGVMDSKMEDEKLKFQRAGHCCPGGIWGLGEG